MSWLLWRQHRMQLALAAVGLIALGIPIWLTGTHLASALNSCQAAGTCGSYDLLHHYGPMRAIVNVTIAIPLLIGVFWGATIFGRELDTGTATLVWTQSVTRRHWMLTKLISLFGLVVGFSAAISGLVTWWSNPANSTLETRFDGPQFDIQGIAPIAFAIFGAALGLAAGALWRRVLPAMATTVGAFVAVRLIIELYVRPHYMAPLTKTVGMTESTQVPNGSLVIGNDLVLHGQVVNGPVPVQAACKPAIDREQMDACMNALGYRIRTTYQPASRYWTFQWIEFGIFTALAVLLVALAVVAVRRRDA